jgi:hypothetical protein
MRLRLNAEVYYIGKYPPPLLPWRGRNISFCDLRRKNMKMGKRKRGRM